MKGMKPNTASRLSSAFPRRQFLERMAVAAVLGGAGVARAAQGTASGAITLGVHHYSVRRVLKSGQATLETLPRFAKHTLGVTNLELAEELSGAIFESPAMARRVRQNAEGEGVRVLTLLCGADHALDAASAAGRQKAVDHHLRILDVARLLNCRFIRIRAGQPGDRKVQLDRAVAGVSALCDRLGPGDARPLVENVTGLSRDPQWLLALVQAVGLSRCGVLADFGNFDGDIYQGMKTLLPHTDAICTKSWDFDAAGNETKIDFAKMCQLVVESGFKGCVSMEYLGEKTGDVEGVKQTAALLRRYL